jgi:BASS family bile acid:Na+ symporter
VRNVGYIIFHKHIDVPFQDMMSTILWVVLLPLTSGLIISKVFSKTITRIRSILPSIAILIIAILIGCVVALNRQNILALPLVPLLAVIFSNLCGLVGPAIMITLGFF